MSASQQGPEVAGDVLIGERIVQQSLLDQRHEQRAGQRANLQLLGRASATRARRPAGDGRMGADHTRRVPSGWPRPPPPLRVRSRRAPAPSARPASSAPPARSPVLQATTMALAPSAQQQPGQFKTVTLDRRRPLVSVGDAGVVPQVENLLGCSKRWSAFTTVNPPTPESKTPMGRCRRRRSSTASPETRRQRNQPRRSSRAARREWHRSVAARNLHLRSRLEVDALRGAFDGHARPDGGTPFWMPIIPA